MKDFIEYVVRALVDYPDEVKITDARLYLGPTCCRPTGSRAGYCRPVSPGPRRHSFACITWLANHTSPLGIRVDSNFGNMDVTPGRREVTASLVNDLPVFVYEVIA